MYPFVVEDSKGLQRPQRPSLRREWDHAEGQGRQLCCFEQVAELVRHDIRSAETVPEDGFLHQQHEAVVAVAQHPVPAHSCRDCFFHVVRGVTERTDC